MKLGRVTKTGEGNTEAENWTMGGSVSCRPPQTAFSRAGTAGRMPSWLTQEGQWNAGQSEHWEKKGRKQGRSHLSWDPVLSQGLEREDVLWFPKRCFDCTVGNESKQRPTAIREAMRRLSPQSVDRDHGLSDGEAVQTRGLQSVESHICAAGMQPLLIALWKGGCLCLYFPSEDVGVEGFNSHTELHSRDMQMQHRVSPPLKGSALGWHNHDFQGTQCQFSWEEWWGQS